MTRSAFASLVATVYLIHAAPCALAEENRPPPPRRGNGEEALTADQESKVAAILSRYHAASLSAADARAIHTAFRDAGLRAGEALVKAVRKAGFDPERLRQLDPPPEDRGGRGREGGPRGERGEGGRGGRDGSPPRAPADQ
jgi:hypothetical protein